MASSPANNSDDNAVRVMVRVRLFNSREKEISVKKNERLRPCVRMRGNTCAVIEYFKDEKGFTHEREREAFEYSECFWSIPPAQYASDNAIATQLSVYEKSGKMALQHALQGFNVCVFAYGQTGSGKTFSMLGSDAEPGISPRLVDDLFIATAKRREAQPSLHIVIEVMFFEIYNEKVRDLFNKQSKSGDYEAPRIRTHRTRGVYVDGLLRKEVADAVSAKALIEKGTKERAMAETKMNAHSSRSHAVFQICITSKDPLRGTQCTSLVNLVDLAGSEKINLSGVTGQAMKEAMNINKSLSTLRRVFDVLIENTQQKKQMVPPFRDSVLTHVLTDSLGGNSKTQMLATISPHEANLEDTLQTLRYANQAKAIVCDAKVNEEKSAEMVEAMKDEIEKLRRMMAEGVTTGGGVALGGEMAMSPEMARELQEKEAEFSRIMEEQAEMKREQERMREEQARKEAEMQELQQNMKMMEDKKQQMDVTLTQQKSERFAAAFRNAYLLSKEKKSNQAQVAELVDLRSRVEGMSSRLRFLEEDMGGRQQEINDLTIENERLHTNIDDERAISRRTITELETRRRDMENLCTTLDNKVQSLEGDLHTLLDTYDASQNKVNRLEMELGGYMVAAERESIEKGKIKEAYHTSFLRSNEEMDAVRRRKEKYKREATEEKSKVQSYSKAIETFKGDRDSYSETIRAQQSLLNEKIFLLEAMKSELDATKKRERQFKAVAEERLETIRVLNESVQQYQDASLKFMTDITLKDKEIERLRALVDESRSFVSTQSSSNRIMRGVPIAHVDPTSPARPRSPGVGYRARATNLPQPLIQDLSRGSVNTSRHSPMRRV